MSDAAISLDNVQEAHAALHGVAQRTPLIECPELSARSGVRVSFKCEHLQPVGAFKLRGAYTAIRRRLAAHGRRGVVTHSSGNHAQAVAYAAHHLGVTAVAVMPNTAPAIKVERTRRWGAEVVWGGQTDVQLRERAEELESSRELFMIPPFDDPDIVAGQATTGVEIIEDDPSVSQIIVPAGGGGLAGGIAAAIKSIKPDIRITVVEPENAPTVTRALAAGRPARLERTESVADGLLPLEAGRLPVALLRDVECECVLVSDEAIRHATVWLHDELDLLVEPSAATGVAALLSGQVRVAGPLTVVLTGGNIAASALDEWR